MDQWSKAPRRSLSLLTHPRQEQPTATASPWRRFHHEMISITYTLTSGTSTLRMILFVHPPPLRSRELSLTKKTITRIKQRPNPYNKNNTGPRTAALDHQNFIYKNCAVK